MTSALARSRPELESVFGAFRSDTRIRLLEAIGACGSISKAAKAVPLSYKAAWDAVDAMNNLAEQPIVVRATGGKHGGGTQLTDYGRKLVTLFRALEAEYQAALDRVSASMQEEAGDLGHLQQVIRRMAMKTSARNQFAGQVCGLKKGVVDFEVRIRLDSDNEIFSVITVESAENMELRIGRPVIAMVKSSSVMLLADPELKTSARNQLWGEVSHIQPGPVNSEVTLRLPGGKTVCAVITHDSVEALGITLGGQACAVFKASAVILSTYA